MIFVHSRKETSRTAEAMRDLAGRNGIYMYTYMYVYVYIYIYIYICVCVFVYMCLLYMNIYIYIYKHIYLFNTNIHIYIKGRLIYWRIFTMSNMTYGREPLKNRGMYQYCVYIRI
jgi:hypothetical protein